MRVKVDTRLVPVEYVEERVWGRLGYALRSLEDLVFGLEDRVGLHFIVLLVLDEHSPEVDGGVIIFVDEYSQVCCLEILCLKMGFAVESLVLFDFLIY